MGWGSPNLFSNEPVTDGEDQKEDVTGAAFLAQAN